MKKDFRKTSAAHLIKAAGILEISYGQLGHRLGVSSGNTVHRWVQINEAPLWTELACEALLSRHGRVQKSAAFFLVAIPSTAPEETGRFIKTVVEGLDGTAIPIKLDGAP